MTRRIDERKQRRALRKLRKAAERARSEGGSGLSDWEDSFLEEVEARIETYGSAFADPDKGRLDEPLSQRQSMKLKEIDRKSRGKGGMRRSKGLTGRPFRRKRPKSSACIRDTNADADRGERSAPERAGHSGKPVLRLIRTQKPDRTI